MSATDGRDFVLRLGPLDARTAAWMPASRDNAVALIDCGPAIRRTMRAFSPSPYCIASSSSSPPKPDPLPGNREGKGFI